MFSCRAAVLRSMVRRMADQFHTTDGDLFSSASHFAEDILHLFGHDFEPDPLFLEEAWTFGMRAAAQNLNRRRTDRTNRELQNRAFRELQNLGSVFFIEHDNAAAESLLEDHANKIPNHYASAGLHPSDSTIARITGDLQHDGSCEDADYIADSGEMSVERAHQLLGTTTTSTREQIRSAYRRMVRELHPDRLRYAPEPALQRATQQVAAVNEAYRLLCTALLW
jgi:DnaJ-domain-containing protein 1